MLLYYRRGLARVSRFSIVVYRPSSFMLQRYEKKRFSSKKRDRFFVRLRINFVRYASRCFMPMRASTTFIT